MDEKSKTLETAARGPNWLPRLVRPEGQCVMPAYLPGDVVRTKDGEIGVITKAQVIVNGRSIDWNEALPSQIEHGWAPSYALDAIPGYKRPHKHAWWEASEWLEAALGPLHDVLSNVKDTCEGENL